MARIYVGLKFQEILSSRNIEFRNLSRSEVDYYDFKTLNDVIANNKPEFVLNAGGFTGKPNVDQCEINKKWNNHWKCSSSSDSWSGMRT